MSATAQETRPAGPLRIGLIADPQRLKPLAQVVESCVLVHLVAQAGMPQAAALRDAAWFDDPRVLIAHPELEAVLLATAPRKAALMAGLAAGRGLHVWQLPPLACTFAEAVETAGRARKLATIYRVASWWEYVAENVWHELRWPTAFKPLYSNLHTSAPGPAPESWRADSADTAGGALTDLGYPLLEALVATRGLPDSVNAAIASYRTTAAGGPRQTEDTAVAILRYSGGGTALIHAAWDQPPFEHRLVHQSADITAVLTREEAAVLDPTGAALDRHPLPGEFLAHELLRFTECVRGQARERAALPLDRHLAVHALLEAVYLAARTGHPEAPGKYYQVQGLPEPQP
jgi:predicted dehydrogenase